VTINGPQTKAARQLLGWTQAQLAVEVGISPATVSLFEGGRHISGWIVSEILKALEAAGVEFTNGSEPRIKLRQAPK
jgi:transcriptional regulator with XRE-family HTH domain